MPGSDKTTKSSKPADAVPHYHGHRSRLRERFVQGGSDALHDYEMLELVLFRAIPRRDVKPLAKELLEKFGSSPRSSRRPSSGSRKSTDWEKPRLPISRSCRRQPTASCAARSNSATSSRRGPTSSTTTAP